MPVTEAEWLAATDPWPMLQAMGTVVSERKLQLYAVARCRRVFTVVCDQDLHDIVRLAERCADGEVPGECLRAWYMPRNLVDAIRCLKERRRGLTPADRFVLGMCSMAIHAEPHQTLAYIQLLASDIRHGQAAGSLADVEVCQGVLFRDIFGNPFRPSPDVEAARNRDSVCWLVQGAYEARSLPSGTLQPSQVALLADAVEDAGCTDAELLGHLRGPGPHVRGCWAVDLMLGKS
jgi:hypothetical protein